MFARNEFNVMLAAVAAPIYKIQTNESTNQT
jgi:hypothetical protein